MGSSVEISGIFDLWKTIFSKAGTLTTPPRKVAFLWGILWAALCCFLHRHLLQMVFVQVKTAGY